MPRYKLILILILVFSLLFFLINSDQLTNYVKSTINNQNHTTPLPGWLTLSHRLSGPYAFDYIPLDFDDLALANGDNDIQNSVTPAGSTYINPSGSPYPPGTLADMIWQQKQQDQRYGN
ncbi:MAG: hypothetical protein FJ152_09315 [Firmicutes bacterium]|nr:hypothetical protein [Bacillota bacterium]